jgi:LL-diaminopimelate aminotransferase
MTTTLLKPAARMSVLPPSFFKTLQVKLNRLHAAGVDVIRMDMGSPDMPPAPHIVDALERSANEPDHHGYMPFGGTPAYRAAWGDFYGRRFGVELDADTEINGLLGSKEGIFKLPLAYVNPGEVVLIPDPGYITYSAGAHFVGAEVVYMPLTPENNFLPDFEALTPEVVSRARLMWLNYPNNPTGAVASLEFFGRAVDFARRHGILLAHDAPYTEITFDGYRAPSVLQIPGAKDVAVEFHSLSKTANMGGWRSGVVVGNADVIRYLSSLQSNVDSGSFRPILDAAIVALTGDSAWQVERNEIYRQRRDQVVAGVRAAGLVAAVPAAAIYVWARLPEGVDDNVYADNLLDEAGVTVTPGSFFGPSGRGYVRLSLCTPTDRIREAMARWQAWAGRR